MSQPHPTNSPPRDAVAELAPVYRWLPYLIYAGLAVPYAGSQLFYDEAYTLTQFVANGPRAIFLDGYSPNNHVLFTFALYHWWGVCVEILGLPLWTLRLAPLGFSLAAVWLVYGATLGAFGSRLWATLAAAFLASSHVFIAFSCQLRGYSLSTALLAFTLALAVRYRRTRRLRNLWPLFIASFLAGWALPTNLLPVAAVAGWLCLDAALIRGRWDWHLALLFLVPFAGLIGYIPIARAVLTEARRGWGMPHTWVISQLVVGNLASWAPVIGGLLLLMLGSRFDDSRKGANPARTSLRLERGTPQGLWPLAFTSLSFPVLGMLAFKNAPFERNFIPFLPLWCLLLAGWGRAVLERGPARARIAGALLLAQCFYAALFEIGFFEHMKSARVMADRPLGLTAQFYASPLFRPRQTTVAALGLCKTEGFEIIVTDDSDLYSLVFYAGQIGFRDIFYFETGAKLLDSPKLGPSRRERLARVLFITRSPEALDRMLGMLRVERDGRETTMLRDCGYFKLFRVRARWGENPRPAW